ncbi:hypothetical protein [Butyrivibrio sp. AE3006]|uniref:hypothetical protein n=1 Tax=Butyrivibrio sp. AE3006 TaxID=1280673 RepID=UPI0004239409|nr:hypothetical protein [Butyrivibrio sp. AE3006]
MQMNYMANILVWPCATFKEDEYLWIFHGKINALFRYNLMKEKLEYMASLVDEKSVQESLMCQIVKVSKKIYLIPHWGNHIHLYDVTLGRDTIIHLRNEEKYRGKRLFCAAYLLNNQIYCVPDSYNYFIAINPENNEIYYLFDVKKQLSDYGIDMKYITSSTINLQQEIYAVMADSNLLIKLDYEKKCFSLIKPINEKSIISHLVFLNGCKYAIEYGYDGEKRRVVRLEDGCEIYEVNSFITFGVLKDCILVDSVHENWMEVIDEHGKVIQKISEEKLLGYPMLYSYNHGILVGNEQKDYYFSRRTNKIMKVSNDKIFTRTGKLLFGKCPLNLFCGNSLYEDRYTNLEALMRLLG